VRRWSASVKRNERLRDLERRSNQDGTEREGGRRRDYGQGRENGECLRDKEQGHEEQECQLRKGDDVGVGID